MLSSQRKGFLFKVCICTYLSSYKLKKKKNHTYVYLCVQYKLYDMDQ